MHIYEQTEQDIFGQALLDFVQGNYEEDIITYISLGEKDVLPLPHLFRDFDKMPPLEREALELSRGKVLDVGCGAGSHSLHLQKRGLDVTALDYSGGAVQTCKIRGLDNVIYCDFWHYSGTKFDTILFLMHGIGMAGNLDRLDAFLRHVKSLLRPGGQVLLDSSDIIYMFEKDEDGGYWVPGDVAYYGEVSFITEYKGVKSAPFPWLFLDYNSLEEAATNINLTCECVSKGQHYDYLARLTLNS